MKKVLIYNGDMELLGSLQACLEHFDFSVQTVTGKPEFYKNLEEYKPDVVMIDVMLHGTDGRTVCRSLKDDKKYSHHPVILFACSSNLLHDYKNNGADGILEMPFEINDIGPLVNSVIEKRN